MTERYEEPSISPARPRDDVPRAGWDLTRESLKRRQIDELWKDSAISASATETSSGMVSPSVLAST
jgi:hypothetical protein